jgi:hypothetical protein
MNNIHCMYCGHSIELGTAYDTYKGPLRCSVCKSLMMVRVEQGQLRAMEAGPQVAAAATTQSSAAHPN